MVLLFMLLSLGCARSLIKSPDQAMRPMGDWPNLTDDLDFAGLGDALDKNLEALRSRREENLKFGERTIARADYIQALEDLAKAARAGDGGQLFRTTLRENFEPMETYGRDRWGEVFVTSYFEPVIEGSLKPQGRFRMPLYSVPKDMVYVDLGTFPAFSEDSRSQMIPGRLVKVNGVNKVVALPQRASINAGAVDNTAEPLVWVDPIDGFFLQVQGSGTVRLANGQEMRLGYAAQNGHAYVAIGKFLTQQIPIEDMSLMAIEEHLRKLPPEESDALLNRNPSYVFLRPLKGAGVTTLGAEVTDGRTIATDARFFPKGALAWLTFRKPEFDSPETARPARWTDASRFVVDQDTGGAITGPGRVDLFWGRGSVAKQGAGAIRNKGRLIYFVPRLKKSALAKINR